MTLKMTLDSKGVALAVARAPELLFEEMHDAMRDTLAKFDGIMQDDRLNHSAGGPVQPVEGGLRNVSGRLKQSLNGRVEGRTLKELGFVYGFHNVRYAAIQEFGGTINHPGGTAYGIDAESGKFQFISKSNEAASDVFGRTGPHQITIPPRMGMFDAWDRHIDDDTIPRLNRGVRRTLKRVGGR